MREGEGEGEAVEKHSISETCHEGIYRVTSASCHTMTNGFAIFCPTGRQQRTFPLSREGGESTVFVISLAFLNSNEVHSLHFQTEVNSRREKGLVVSQLLLNFILFLLCKTILLSYFLICVQPSKTVQREAMTLFWAANGIHVLQTCH